MDNTNFLDKKRIVLNFGTKSLTPFGGIDSEIIKRVSDDISYLKMENKYFTIVSSGELAKARQTLGDYSDASIIKEQCLSAVGQHGLVHNWDTGFKGHGYKAAQFLVTKNNFDNPDELKSLSERYLGILEETVISKCIPVFNENKTVSNEYTSFGNDDNLNLAFYVTTKLKNDLLILMAGKDENLESKVETAKMCNEKGIPCIISEVQKLYNLLTGDAPRKVFQNYPKDLFSEVYGK